MLVDCCLLRNTLLLVLLALAMLFKYISASDRIGDDVRATPEAIGVGVGVTVE